MAGHFEPTSDGGAAIALDEVEISILRSLAVQLVELIGPGSEPASGPPPAPASDPGSGAGEGPQESPAPGGIDEELAGIEGVSWPPFGEGPTEPPADPALARLFPDAYGPGPEGKPDEKSGGGMSSYGDDAPGTPGASAHESSAARAAEVRSASAEFRRYTENDLRARKRADGLAMVRALDGLEPGEQGAVLTLAPDDSRQWLGALNDLRLAIGTRLEVRDDSDSELYRLPDSDPRKPMIMAYLWLGGLQETLIETLMP